MKMRSGETNSKRKTAHVYFDSGRKSGRAAQKRSDPDIGLGKSLDAENAIPAESS